MVCVRDHIEYGGIGVVKQVYRVIVLIVHRSACPLVAGQGKQYVLRIQFLVAHDLVHHLIFGGNGVGIRRGAVLVCPCCSLCNEKEVLILVALKFQKETLRV